MRVLQQGDRGDSRQRNLGVSNVLRIELDEGDNIYASEVDCGGGGEGVRVLLPLPSTLSSVKAFQCQGKDLCQRGSALCPGQRRPEHLAPDPSAE